MVVVGARYSDGSTFSSSRWEEWECAFIQRGGWAHLQEEPYTK